MRQFKERHVYFFRCGKCDRRRQSLKRSRARKGICRRCRGRQAGEVSENQLGLFPVPAEEARRIRDGECADALDAGCRLEYAK